MSPNVSRCTPTTPRISTTVSRCPTSSWAQQERTYAHAHTCRHPRNAQTRKHAPTHPRTHAPTHPRTHAPTHPRTHAPTHPRTHARSGESNKQAQPHLRAHTTFAYKYTGAQTLTTHSHTRSQTQAHTRGSPPKRPHPAARHTHNSLAHASSAHRGLHVRQLVLGHIQHLAHMLLDDLLGGGGEVPRGIGTRHLALGHTAPLTNVPVQCKGARARQAHLPTPAEATTGAGMGGWEDTRTAGQVCATTKRPAHGRHLSPPTHTCTHTHEHTRTKNTSVSWYFTSATVSSEGRLSPAPAPAPASPAPAPAPATARAATGSAQNSPLRRWGRSRGTSPACGPSL
jgi:hypothetical protein